jgi:hypothetical protein
MSPIKVDIDFAVLFTASLFFAVLLGLALWARWLRRRAVAPRYLPWTAWGLLAASVVLPVVWLVVVLPRAVAAMERSGPGGLGTVSFGISEPLLVAVVAILLALGILLATTWRWHWSDRKVTPKGDPPYR